jgi:hypothetical protein
VLLLSGLDGTRAGSTTDDCEFDAQTKPSFRLPGQKLVSETKRTLPALLSYPKLAAHRGLMETSAC